SAGTRYFYFGLGGRRHIKKKRQTQLLEYARRNIYATLAILADTGLHTRAGQQHADFQGGRLGTHNIERSEPGEDSRAQAGRYSAARHAFDARIRFAAHRRCSSRLYRPLG